MTTDAGRAIAEFLADFARPFAHLADHPEDAVYLARLSGWDLNAAGLDPRALAELASAFVSALSDLDSHPADRDLGIETLLSVLPGLARAIDSLTTFGDGLPLPPDAPADLAEQFVEDLLSGILVYSLGRYHPAVRSSLEALSILKYQPRAEVRVGSAVVRPAQGIAQLDFAQIGHLFSDPRSALLERFGLAMGTTETAAIIAQRCFPLWAALLRDLGVRAWAGTMHFPPGLLSPSQIAALERTLLVWLPFDRSLGSNDTAGANIALTLFDLPGGGIEMVIAPQGSLGLSRRIGDWDISLVATGSVEAVSITSSSVGFASGNASLDLHAGVGRVRGSASLFRIGALDGPHLEVGAISLEGGLALSTTRARPSGSFRLAIDRLAFKGAATPGDGFLGKTLPADGFSVVCDVSIEWDGQGPLRFAGAAGLDLALPLNLALGPISLSHFRLVVQAGVDGLTAAASVNVLLNIGPVSAVVEDIGLQAVLRLGGQVAVPVPTVGFKPPTGIGLSIDTPTVKAGGFLSIDIDRGRYVGALELSILNKFDLSAIAIITTQSPDGSPGFSLLFLISMTLPVPVPLGYNFYFAGAGGLLGLNRGVDIDHLRDGLRTGTADNILFPTDVVRRIDAIVLDLNASFPQTEGQFLVGPMALITWSTPPLISVKLGLVIEIGSPVRIAILGVLRATLPDAKDPILDLKVAFLGSIDIQAELLSFDASIFDSYIGRGSFKLFIEGDMALRLSWGKQPDFVTSIGGFHPSFRPQNHLHLPVMRRMSLSLLKDNPRLSLSLYLAVTSNRIQCGARLDFFFKVSEFSVVGDFGFDVLFQFPPFHIDAHVYAGLAVKCGDTDVLSLRLDFNLLGPNPWIARGIASFTILFFTVSVQFEKRFGEEAIETLPDIEVLQALIDEFKRNESWRAELTTGEQTLVVVRELTPTTGTVVIDASGRLTVGQRILPLDTDFSRFGTSRPKDAQRVSVKALRIGGIDEDFTIIQDDFAPAAFREMADSDKLAAAPFERRPSGVQATTGQSLSTDAVVPRPVAYEVIISDSVAGASPTPRIRTPESDGATFDRLTEGGAAGKSMAARNNARRAEVGKVLGLGSTRERFAVASNRDLRPLAADGQPAAVTGNDANGRPKYVVETLIGRTDAEQRRADLLSSGGFSPDELEIIPEAQLAA